VTDSSACLRPGTAAALRVRVVPLQVSLGEWLFADDAVEPAAFYARLRAEPDTLPTTSQPSPGAWAAVFTAAAEAGADRLLVLTCGAQLSGTHASARLAADLSPVPVDLVDSQTISGGLHLVVLALARALGSGDCYDDVLALAQSLSGRIWSTWSGDTTRLLAAGGRDGGALAADDAGTGVPVLGLEGSVRVLGHARSPEDSVRLQAERLRAALAAVPGRVTVGHGDAAALADDLAGALAGAPGLEGIDRYEVPPSVGAHAGPGNVGASYVAPRAPARR